MCYPLYTSGTIKIYVSIACTQITQWCLKLNFLFLSSFTKIPWEKIQI